MENEWTAVFDLDGSLETPYFGKSEAEKVKAWMEKHPCGNTFDRMYAEVMDGLPHFFLNGALELLRWVHDQGFEIVFFSNAVVERNRELCPIIMERAFGKGKEPPYRVLSRGDCVDTAHMDDAEGRAFQGLWHGNYKKKLSGVVVPEDRLPNTLMIEDDNSYAVKGEEKNFVYGVYGGCANMFVTKPELSEHSGQDFHLPFYFCGMLKRIVAYAKKANVSLVEAAVQVQYADYGFLFPLDGNRPIQSNGGQVRIPDPPWRNFSTVRAQSGIIPIMAKRDYVRGEGLLAGERGHEQGVVRAGRHQRRRRLGREAFARGHRLERQDRAPVPMLRRER